MAVLTIYDVNQPCLRTRCKKVSRLTPSERKILEDMVETMRAANGIGLAAAQVGIPQRLIVVEVEDELYQLANPEIVDLSDETEVMREGCLSLPNYYGPVERPVRAVVRGLDLNGKRIKVRAEGLLARVLQHEIDHLDGVLFFDRMRSLSELQYEAPDAEGAGSNDDDAPCAEGSGTSSRHRFRTSGGAPITGASNAGQGNGATSESGGAKVSAAPENGTKPGSHENNLPVADVPAPQPRAPVTSV